MNPHPFRVVLADDHHLVRAGIKALLDSSADFAVVGECADGADAVRLVGEVVPDVVLMDVAMRSTTGLQALEGIRRGQPTVKVVMLSMHEAEEYVVSALRLGASGYVLKNSLPEELMLALRTVVGGGTWLSAPISRQVLDGYLERVTATNVRDGLTPRQLQVLSMIAEGLRTKEIAFNLGVSVKTVETYRAQLLKRLGVQETAGLVRYAIRHGISGL